MPFLHEGLQLVIKTSIQEIEHKIAPWAVLTP